jgi:membrane protease YdiL (CAAX protease family)
MSTARSLPRLSLSPAAALVSLAAGVLLLAVAARALFPIDLRLALMGSELALVAPSLLALAAARIPLARGLALRPIGVGVVALSAAIGLALWVASLGLIELQASVWPPSREYLETFRQLHEALHPRGPLDALVSLTAIALLPAACEESLLRGIVLPSLLRLGDRWAIGLSAVIFALIHWDAYRFAFPLLLGLALGVLRLRSGSLWPSFTMHGLFNAATFVSVPFLDPPTAELPEPHPALGALLLGVGSLACILLIRRFPSLTAGEAPPRLES